VRVSGIFCVMQGSQCAYENASITRPIAGCRRFFTLAQCVRYFQNRTFVNARGKSESGRFGLMHHSRESNYSITSSALIKMEFGIDKPSNFAVRALTISSWVVGSSMGMSPGFVPFRILSMKYPYRRN